jgi:DNA-binding GntR family transcriptional regulator
MANPAVTKRDQIVDELRRLISSGDLARGDRLPQDELARRFNASITPVREALRLLEAEGLVVAEPHRGVRVAGVDLERIKGLYVLRRLAEGYAMRRVVQRLSPRDIAEVTALLDQMQATIEAGDLAAVRDMNRQFHFFFYERCGMAALCDEIRVIWRSFPWDLRLNSMSRLEASHREHLEILAAVKAGDVSAAAAATERHIQHGYLSIAAHLTGHDAADPFDLHVD